MLTCREVEEKTTMTNEYMREDERMTAEQAVSGQIEHVVMCTAILKWAIDEGRIGGDYDGMAGLNLVHDSFEQVAKDFLDQYT